MPPLAKLPRLLIFVLLIVAAATVMVDTTIGLASEPVLQDHGMSELSENRIVDGEPGRVRDRENPGLISNLLTLLMLILLQAVLGFDNLLYISLESKHAPEKDRKRVQAIGIGLAIFLRIGLLFLLYYLQDFFEKTSLFAFDLDLGINLAKGNCNLHSLIVLGGGGFIIYTAMKEIWHMTRLEHDHGHETDAKPKSVNAIIFWIVVMNLVFSFDSILSAMALTDVLWVMALAIVVSGLLMIYLAETVSTFLAKNRMYEVLGLFVLFVVGIMLVSEGGHLAHISLLGNEVMPMTKTTFYFVLAVLVLTDIVQGRYQKKLLAEKEQASAAHRPEAV